MSGGAPDATDRTENERVAGTAGCDGRLALYVVDRLRSLGSVSVRRLGALYGLFHDGGTPDAPIGIVSGAELYLKAGPDAVTRYIASGMRPFRPGPRQPLRGYWRVPQEVLADPQALCAWAAAAVDASRRFGRRRRPLRRRKK